MSEETNGGTETKTFSAEYVSELRQEAAQWRVKCREMEQQNKQLEVATELSNRGVKASPKWVDIQEGQSVKEAVDSFVSEYPNLVNTSDNSTPAPQPTRPTRGPQVPAGNTNTAGPRASGQLSGRSMAEIKKDPKARTALRNQYRELLMNASNRNTGE